MRSNQLDIARLGSIWYRRANQMVTILYHKIVGPQREKNRAPRTSEFFLTIFMFLGHVLGMEHVISGVPHLSASDATFLEAKACPIYVAQGS